MGQESQITLAAAILAFAAAIISTAASLHSARLARYAHEKWWDRKVEAYTRIVDSLPEMVEYYRMAYSVELEGKHIAPARKAEFEDRWRKGWQEVRKATNIGTFLVSEQANTALQALWKSFDDAAAKPNWFDRIESEFDSAEKCLAILIAAAKTDLKVAKI